MIAGEKDSKREKYLYCYMDMSISFSWENRIELLTDAVIGRLINIKVLVNTLEFKISFILNGLYTISELSVNFKLFTIKKKKKLNI